MKFILITGLCLSLLFITGLAVPYGENCEDLTNPTCLSCLENGKNLTCKYVIFEKVRACRSVLAPLVTNATSVTDPKDCSSVDPKLLGLDSTNGGPLRDEPDNTTTTVTTPEPTTPNTTTPTTTVTTEAPTTTVTPTTPTTVTTRTTTVTPTTTQPNTTVTTAPTPTEPPTEPTTTATTTTTTVAPTTTVVPDPTTTIVPTTTVVPSTTTVPPPPSGRGFDAASFFGGIGLVLGLLGIGYFGLKFYRHRVDRSYHTL